MPKQSRRKFLQRSSVGVVAVGAAMTPGLIAQQPASARALGPVPDGPLVAYIRDPSTGEIAVMLGEQELVYRDAELAARLAHAAHGRTA